MGEHRMSELEPPCSRLPKDGDDAEHGTHTVLATQGTTVASYEWRYFSRRKRRSRMARGVIDARSGELRQRSSGGLARNRRPRRWASCPRMQLLLCSVVRREQLKQPADSGLAGPSQRCLSATHGDGCSSLVESDKPPRARWVSVE
jgi:hypothetical protein